MTYTIVRNAPEPTFEQLGRELGCCPYCLDGERPTTKHIPYNVFVPTGMEQIALLAVGDAIDSSFKDRQRMGNVARAYDMLNGTKHELYMLDAERARCWRYR